MHYLQRPLNHLWTKLYVQMFCLFLTGSVFLSFSHTLFAVDSEWMIVRSRGAQQRYFQALRDRRLYELAELLCQQAINDRGLTPKEKLPFQLELAKTYRDHALSLSWPEATELWDRALQMLDAPGPHLERRQIEACLLALSRLDQIFWLRQLDPTQLELREQWQLSSQNCLKRIEQTKKLISTNRQSGQFSMDAAMRDLLEDELPLAVGRCYLRMAEVVRDTDLERNRWLNLSREALQRVRRSVLSQTAYLQARLLLLRAARIGEQRQQFQQLAVELAAEQTDAQYASRVLGERVRWLLEHEQPLQAEELISNLDPQIIAMTPELRSLRLQALVQMSLDVENRGEQGLAQELRQAAQAGISQLEQEGHYFEARQASLTLAGASLRNQYGPELTAYLQQIQQLLKQGHATAALTTYQQAIQFAVDQGRWTEAIELTQQFTQLGFQQRAYETIANQLQLTWSRSPNYPGMEQIHLLWMEALEKNYSVSPSRESLDAYAAAIQDHLQRYPQRDSRFEAIWKLAELTFAQRRFVEAIQRYQQIPVSQPRYDWALMRVGQCHAAILYTSPESMVSAEQTNQKQAAIKFSAKLLRDTTSQDLKTPARVTAVFQACRILRSQATNAEVTSLLTRTLNQLKKTIESGETHPLGQASTPEQRTDWSQTVILMQASILLEQNQHEQAITMLESSSLKFEQPQDVLKLLEQFNRLEIQDARTAEILGNVSIRFIQGIQPHLDQMTASQQRLMRQYEAEAEYRRGRLSLAIPIYRELTATLRANDPLTLRYSELLEECANSSCHQMRYQLWKQKAGSSKQGRIDWHRSRFELARACLKTGRVQEAEKIVKVTLLLYPDAGSPELKAGFTRLAEQLQH